MTRSAEEHGDDPRDRSEPLRRVPSPAPAAEPVPLWKTALERMGGSAQEDDGWVKDVFDAPRAREIRYRINVRESRLRDQLVVDFFERETGKDGAMGAWRPFEVDEAIVAELEHEEDRHVLGRLIGNAAEERARAQLDRGVRYGRSVVRSGMYELALPALAATGRLTWDLGLPGGEGESGPLVWDGGDPFRLVLFVEAEEEGTGWRLWGRLRRSGRVLDLGEPTVLLSSGLAVLPDALVRIEVGDTFDWAFRLRRNGALKIPKEARDDFVVHLATMPNLPEIDLPPELHWSQAKIRPVPRMAFATAEESTETKWVVGKLSFDYGGETVSVGSKRRIVADADGRQLFRRDFAAERETLERLRGLGLEPAQGEETKEGEVRVAAKDLTSLVKQLVDEGWVVEAGGERVRTAGALKSKVTSGIDWFDLEVELDFGGVMARLPELLRAAAGGGRFVQLPDGSKGIAPDWLRRYAAFAQTGKMESGRLRFLQSQAGIIDALLTGHQDASTDVKFDRIQKSLRREARKRATEPKGFQGQLRDYQREGLAWMQSLEAFEAGGCLADDMGLGKTVQVLSLLLGRHRPGGERDPRRSPSLIVVPKSLVYNWISESAKFSPELKVLNYTGSARTGERERLEDYDLIVTTYGTLRQDILHFLDVRFESLVLDEAQAIKNPGSQSTKACRLLSANHRLAISGTPIENNLQELWSICDFLNPGMLGPLSDFAANGKDKDEEWLELLSTALRPFMLRRTKDQVLTELPAKTEKTLFVDLEPDERKRYDELRAYYRTSLTSRIGQVGLARSKIHVLEALLRLRQAACHPGLIDKTKMDHDSSKLDVLFEHLRTVADTGHKALVFSQFTTLLEVVRRRLDREEISYSYLDGSTRDRKATVDAFQEDPSCKVFLISLKAGGCGLNLTSSDYVFILDPWWNPAVEAQAIDRAHRMGQKRPVFAYRLIARDTVEEKIVGLQDEKRMLADAIITGDRSVMKELTAEDLDRLFA